MNSATLIRLFDMTFVLKMGNLAPHLSHIILVLSVTNLPLHSPLLRGGMLVVLG